MSKFSNILNMLIILKSRGKTKIKDIADALEVDERMIRKYRDDLELAGVYIKSTPGINGGYELESPEYILDLELDEDEIVAATLASQQLKDQGFAYQKELEGLIDKLNIVGKEKSTPISQIEYLHKETKSKFIQHERKICIDINRAIISRNKVRIKYFSLSSGLSTRVVQPYAIITYKGGLYFVAYCQKREQVIDFKISRIREYEILEERFMRNPNFLLREYMKDSLGLYKDEKLNIKLKIYKPMSYIISEKIWVDNQKITWIENESIIFEAEMMGKTEIKSWILSMGSNAEVLEPEDFKEEIRKEIENMGNRYLK